MLLLYSHQLQYPKQAHSTESSFLLLQAESKREPRAEHPRSVIIGGQTSPINTDGCNWLGFIHCLVLSTGKDTGVKQSQSKIYDKKQEVLEFNKTLH